MADRDLKLNSLSRYSKESPLLILEEHGHCEVPAGCGGVVLRWRDPRAGVPLVIGLYAEGECTTLLDGQPPAAARTVVPFGEHVLGFVVSGFDPAYLVLMVSVTNPPPSRAVSRAEDPVSIASAADGTWRYTVDRPDDDGWPLPGFADSGWSGLVARPDRRPPDDPSRDYATYRIDRLTRAGAVGLGVPEGGLPEGGLPEGTNASRIWVRRAFTLPEPGTADQGDTR